MNVVDTIIDQEKEMAIVKKRILKKRNGEE